MKLQFHQRSLELLWVIQVSNILEESVPQENSGVDGDSVAGGK
jgi:hypothetical protein